MVAFTRSAALGSLAVALSLFLPMEEAAARPKKRANASESGAQHAKKPARSRCADATHWTSDQLLPLAIVQGTKLSAYEGPCADNKESAKGLRWVSIDERGKAVGEVERVESKEGIESFRGLHGQRGAGVFVRAPAGKMPKITRSWSLAEGDHETLLAALKPLKGVRLADLKGLAIQPFLSDHSTPGKTQTKGESAPGWSSNTKMAVVTLPNTMVVLRHLPGGKWLVEHQLSAPKPRVHLKHPAFQVRSVVDMNGDGVPEIIYHFNEDEAGRGFETVLSSTGHGVWEDRADNEDTGP